MKSVVTVEDTRNPCERSETWSVGDWFVAEGDGELRTIVIVEGCFASWRVDKGEAGVVGESVQDVMSYYKNPTRVNLNIEVM